MSTALTTRSKEPVVVITGATAGVGRATARKFADEGARVGLIARGHEGLKATRAEVDGLGGRAVAVSADVAEYDQIEEAAEEITSKLGPIDIWINNAMTTVFAPASEIEPEEFKRVTEVTYLGYVYGSLVALEHMAPRNKGSIVQVGSALAFRGIPLQSAYCAAKHAVVGFSESLRSELLHEGLDISLSLVHLPAMNTPQFEWCRSKMPRKAQPVPPIYEPEVAADAIHHVAFNPRRQLLVGGPTWKTVWGNRLAPGIADRVLARNGFDSQQTDEPEEVGRRDNLWSPVDGDRGARGRFDNRARDSSVFAWMSEHRGVVATVLGGLAAGAFGAKKLIEA